MQLTPRLKGIVRHISKCSKVADIGTDHAFIPIYLVENNITKQIIATDINDGPLEIAQNQIMSHGYIQYIKTLKGNGLEPIKGYEIENIIIAGMGGILISEIINENKETANKAEKLILQPMVAQAELRKYLINNGFKIIDEDLEKEDRRIYQIIVATKGKEDIKDEIYLDIGYPLIKKNHPLLLELIQFKENELKKIINNCSKQDSPNAIKKKNQCREKLQKLREVKKCL
ncbi:MAG: tRNA (adenine(22)-N(1))-methyltransferase [Eubacteriaceae bacterium]